MKQVKQSGPPAVKTAADHHPKSQTSDTSHNESSLNIDIFLEDSWTAKNIPESSASDLLLLFTPRPVPQPNTPAPARQFRIPSSCDTALNG